MAKDSSPPLRHIKKKFRFERPMTSEELERLGAKSDQVKLKEARPAPKGVKAFLVCDEPKKIIEAFHYSQSGHHYYLPEPDPVLISYNNAYFHLKHLNDMRVKLFDVLAQERMDESIRNEIYAFFGASMGCITSLFTSLEAAINRMIPDSYVFRQVQTQRSVLMNKAQIQEFMSFDQKVKEVVKDCTGKDFAKAHPLQWQHIVNLKDFRDMIIHPKTRTDGNTPYDYLFKRALKFEYDLTFRSVREYINFHRMSEPLIEDCDCGIDL